MDFEQLFTVLPKDPIKWSQQDVCIWLNFIGLKSATIDGACLSYITEEDLITDLNITQGIIRKKILSWLTVGIKQYSKFLNKNSRMDEEPDHIKLVDMMPFNVFQKQSLENEFQKMQSEQNQLENQLENTNNINLKNQAMELEQNDGIYEMMTSHVNIPKLKQNENRQILKEIQNWQPEQINQGYKQNNNERVEKKESRELIIQPAEGPQTNFYSIKENGGKIGRHSTNNILILEESISRHHAEIAFDKENFYLHDIGSTTGSFIKIIDQLVLEPYMIIEMGSNQFLVKETIRQNKPEIILEVIEGPNIKNIYNLQFQDRNKPYSIGRKSSNEIHLPDDHHLSNIHSRIYYIDNKFVLEDLNTTNGQIIQKNQLLFDRSWQRLSKEGEPSVKYLLEDKTVFKIGTTSTYVCKINSTLTLVNVREVISANCCIICCENDRDAFFMPCKHNTSCVKCSKTLKECPICRIKIEDFIKIYKA